MVVVKGGTELFLFLHLLLVTCPFLFFLSPYGVYDNLPSLYVLPTYLPTYNCTTVALTSAPSLPASLPPSLESSNFGKQKRETSEPFRCCSRISLFFSLPLSMREQLIPSYPDLLLLLLPSFLSLKSLSLSPPSPQ